MAIIPKQVLDLARQHHRQVFSMRRSQQRRFRELNEKAIERLRRRLRELTSGGKADSFEAQQARIAYLMAQAANEELVRDLEKFIEDVTVQEGRRIATEHVANEVGSWASYYGAELRPINVEAVLQLDHETLIERHPNSLRTYGQRTADQIRQELQLAKLTRQGIDPLEDTIQQVIGRERWRARRIVRTELSHAYNQTHLQGLHHTRDEIGIETYKTCIVTWDARTDEDSHPLDGQVRALEELFEDGEGRRYDAPPGRPNDREKMVPYMEEDAFEKAAQARAQSGDPEPQAEPEPEPDEPADPNAGVDWPEHPGELNFVQRLGGSTGAELLEDPNTGQRFVMKKGASPEHIRSEMAADAAYQAAGVRVPRFREYSGPNGEPIKLAEFIEGTTLGNWKPGSPDELRGVLGQLKDGFAVDGLLSNRDVIGLNKDNVLIDPDGLVYRIDNGGALSYRAMGSRKNDWNRHPADLWTLRNKAVNAQSADYFSTLSMDDLARQIDGLDVDALVAPLSARDAEIVRGRIDEFGQMRQLSAELGADGYKGPYRDEFVGHVQGLRARGISQRMPKQLTPEKKRARYLSDDIRRGDYHTDRVIDEHGDNFDHLRGSRSLTADHQDYMRFVGGEPALFQRYAGRQAGSSWATTPQAFKVHYQKNVRDVGELFWRDGMDTAERHYKDLLKYHDRSTVARTFASQHAFTYEQLRQMDLPQKRGNLITLMRTEEKKVTDHYGLKVGDRAKQYTKGALESTSVFNPVYVYGTELMRFDEVPIHRVFVTYFQSRGANRERCLMGDGENEMVADLNGVAADYLAAGNPDHD